MPDECARCAELERERDTLAARLQEIEDENDERAEYVATQQRVIRELRAMRQKRKIRT